MKKIKIKFVDWPNSYGTNTFSEILKTKFNVEISENPEYLFFSDFGNEHLNYDCIRVYYTPENLVPDFNICDYAIGYHYISFEDRYLRFPLYGLFEYRKDYEKALKKHIVTAKEINEKMKFCNFIYSNSNADIKRHIFFDVLNKYEHVDSGGKFLNNIGGPVADKHEFQKKYKFSIAFENSSMSGYTTEKIVQAFAAKTIPIYWGDPNIDLFFNEKAFINVQKFNSFDDVVERIKEIDTNPALFAEILNEPMLVKTDLDYQKLENFMFQIFDGGAGNFRRSNILRGQWYQDYHNKMAKWHKKLSSIERYFGFVKKLYMQF
jgi:hypothetical protein